MSSGLVSRRWWNVVVSAGIAASMLACGDGSGQDGASTGAAAAETAQKGAATFKTTGDGITIAVDTLPVKQFIVDASVTNVLKALQNDSDPHVDGVLFEAAIFKTDKGALADGKGQLLFAKKGPSKLMTLHLLMHTDGDGLPEGGQSGAEDMVKGCTPVHAVKKDLTAPALTAFQAIDAYANILATAKAQKRQDRVQDLGEGSARVVSAFVADLGSTAQVYRCTWDDDDVNNYSALVSFDPGADEIRVLLGTFTGDV